MGSACRFTSVKLELRPANEKSTTSCVARKADVDKHPVNRTAVGICDVGGSYKRHGLTAEVPQARVYLIGVDVQSTSSVGAGLACRRSAPLYSAIFSSQ